MAGGAALTAIAATPAAAAAADTGVLSSPRRVFDSREGQTFQGSGTQGVLTKGASPVFRQILFGVPSTFLGDIIPDTAVGAFINIAITNTTGTGALAVTAASTVAEPTASAINWFGASQILANGILVPVSAVGGAGTGDKSDGIVSGINVWIVAGTPGVSSCHFVIDCMGFVEG